MKPFLLSILMLFIFATGQVSAGDFLIGEGDGLDISVWGSKDFNTSVKVRPDGKITIPGLGDVTASGETPMALQSDLAIRLKELINNPIVTVSVREIAKSKVFIFGGGVQSGVVEVNRRSTLLQLLCMIGNTPPPAAAGGVPAAAAGGSGASTLPDYRQAYVLRNGKKIKEDFYRLFINGDTSEDIVIESNDSIFIPQLSDRNIYVLGAVTTPHSIVYREGMTVMEAILECGGFTKFANQNNTLVRRKEADKEVTIKVKAEDLANDGGLQQNIKLKPGDYVIVNEGMF